MAFVDPIILSSSSSSSSWPSHSPSPVTTPLCGSITPISSSPLLPSPSQLFARKIATRISENFPGVDSNGAISRVFSAAITMDSALNSVQGGANGIGNESRDQKIVERHGEQHEKPKKSQARKEGTASSPKKAVAPKIGMRKPRNKPPITAESPAVPDQLDASERGPTEWKGKKKRGGEIQAKIEKKITKPGAIGPTIVKKRKSATSPKVPRQDNASETIDQFEHKASFGEEPLDLLLAEAVRRRKAWTPPKETLQGPPQLENVERGLDEELPFEEHDSAKTHSLGFENLLGDFGYADQQGNCSIGSDQCRNTKGEALTKRRKIELVNLVPSLPAVKPRKQKLPKKKAQTVTGKAIAPFLIAEPGAPSLLQYFETEAQGGNQPNHVMETTTADSTSAATRRKPKTQGLTQATSAKKKGKSKLAPVLHSPKTAMKSVNDQELIFGTSSQLAREESPTCLRAIQHAIQISQPISNENTIFSTGNTTPSISSNLPERVGVTPLAAPKNLWSVASRGLDGSLLTVEVIDLVDTPIPVKNQLSTLVSEPNLIRNVAQGLSCATETGTSRDLSASADIQEVSKTPTVDKESGLTLEQPIPRSLAEASLRNRRQSRSPVKKQKIHKDPRAPPQDPVPKQMPNYHGFTTADLGKEISSFGFKAIKKRNEMIALLERCWESQARIALQTLQPNVKALNPVAPEVNEDHSLQNKPSKRKGKLQEPDAADSTSNVDQAPKKPRGRPRKVPPLPSHPPAEPLHVSDIGPPVPCATPHVPPSQTDIHIRITKAINAAPATHSITHPTFREKMLLYDPILLEDLTAWLNTEGLGKVGWDEEVGIGVVRNWCERESVCCFSRDEGWRARR